MSCNLILKIEISNSNEKLTRIHEGSDNKLSNSELASDTDVFKKFKLIFKNIEKGSIDWRSAGKQRL